MIGPVVGSSDEGTAGDAAERSPSDDGGAAGGDETDPIDELIALSSDGRWAPERTWLSGAEGERAQLERLARACLEEVAVTATLRQIEPAEPYSWRSVAAFEQRMQACFDALVAFGKPYVGAEAKGAWRPGLDPAAMALAYGLDGAAPDPGRVFASVFVLGSIDRDDSAREAVATLRRLAGDPGCLAAAVEALWLASSPRIDVALDDLVDSCAPPLSAAGLDALLLRGVCSLRRLQDLIDHDDPSLRVRACRGLASVAERELAVDLLLHAVDADGDALVRGEALEALAMHRALVPRAREGTERLRSDLRDDGAHGGRMPAELRRRMLWLLAAAGQGSDQSILAAVFDNHPEDALALGFHGHPAHLDALLAHLELEEDSARRVQIGEAILRIVGADDSSPDPARASATALRERCVRVGPLLRSGQRLRFGVPWSPSHSALELEADGAPLLVRQACAHELGIFLAERPVPVRDLAARQLEAIERQRAAVAQRLARGEHQPGRWPLES